MTNKKIGLNEFACILIFSLYPILPVYFRLGSSLMFYYVMLFPAFASLIIVDKRLYIKRDLRPYYPYILLMLFLFVVHGEIKEIIKFVMAPILLILFLYRYMDVEKKFIRAIDTLIIVSGIMCFLGIIEGLTGFNVFTLLNNTDAYIKPDGFRMGIHRVKLSFNMSTNYCNYLIVIVSLVLYRLHTRGLSRRKRRLFSFIHLLVLVNAFFTGSRAPLIVILIIELIVLKKAGHNELLKNIGMAFMAIVAVSVIGAILGLPVFSYVKSYLYVFLSLINSKFQSNIELEFGSNLTVSNHRIRLYQWVYEGVKDQIWFGLGVDSNFVIQVNQWNTKTSIENEYLKTLLHYGVFGLAAEIYRFLFALKKAGRSIRKTFTIEKISFNFIFVVGFLGYCFNFFTVSMQSDSRILGLFIALMLVYNSLLIRDRSSD